MKDNRLCFITFALVCILVFVVTFISFRGVEGFPANTADTVQVCPTCGRASYHLLLPPEAVMTPVPPPEDERGFELDLLHLRFPKRR